MTKKPPPKSQKKQRHPNRLKSELANAPWVLRITEHKHKPPPLFLIRQRILPEQRTDTDNLVAPRSILKERGHLCGQQQRRCLPVLRAILARINDHKGAPLELHQFLNGPRISFRGNLPLDDEAGYKIALIFKLHERIKELDRIELIARRIDRFTREEAGYWYSRITTFGEAANRWAAAGMKTMLAGHPQDPNVELMLDDLRQRA
ncbi:MAG: hypothetical protein K9N48_01430 [Verrucomicrobia bacterium]|nr:hypothetical protein [Verrucomicrobiota bacterium]